VEAAGTEPAQYSARFSLARPTGVTCRRLLLVEAESKPRKIFVDYDGRASRAGGPHKRPLRPAIHVIELPSRGVEDRRQAVAVLDLTELETLSTAFSGSIIDADDARYEEARKVHNGLIDKRPTLIARCRGTADVADAIAFARKADLEISVRGGGHSVAGQAVADGGLMIDLAEMKGIYVDPVTRTVRAQGGVTWGELNRETALHGLATTGGVVSTTGIAGLTLGGGLGWLNGVYGLAVDNLLAVELVTASGDVLHVTDETYPDLFWALRGGGGNFGVATWFEYRLHPLREVFGGLIAHPYDAAPAVLRAFRDLEQPDELWVVAGLVHAPDGSGAKLAAHVVCHVGSVEQAQRDLRPLLELGVPVVSEVGPMPYPAVNTLFDEAYPRGALNYWKSSFLGDLSDGAIDQLIEQFAVTPSAMSAIVLEQFHGAVCRVGVSDTAVPHREPGFNLGIFAEWRDAAATQENVAWARETYNALEPYRAPLRYVNYFSDDDVGGAAVRAAYGPNYDRLVDLKRRYDPENVFHLNHNIDPAAH
jgi:FAD/FMN-containing dehydrogenase